jgi:hypothetical protein
MPTDDLATSMSARLGWPVESVRVFLAALVAEVDASADGMAAIPGHLDDLPLLPPGEELVVTLGFRATDEAAADQLEADLWSAAEILEHAYLRQDAELIRKGEARIRSILEAASLAPEPGGLGGDEVHYIEHLDPFIRLVAAS